MLISCKPIFHPEACDTQLLALLSKAAQPEHLTSRVPALGVQRIEVWTSVHALHLTSALHIKNITHHTDVPGWDDYYRYMAVWDGGSGESGRWEMQETGQNMLSSLPNFTAIRCLGATINQMRPTMATCKGPNDHNRWMVCDDGTICREEHRDRQRRPEDWVLWPNNTYGRRALGMYVSVRN